MINDICGNLRWQIFNVNEEPALAGSLQFY